VPPRRSARGQRAPRPRPTTTGHSTSRIARAYPRDGRPPSLRRVTLREGRLPCWWHSAGVIIHQTALDPTRPDERRPMKPSTYALTWGVVRAGRDSNPHRQIRRLPCVDLVGFGRIWPAQVGCVVDLVGARPVPSDRLDDQRDDQARLGQSKTPGASLSRRSAMVAARSASSIGMRKGARHGGRPGRARSSAA
jgi:hypothetical protein